MSNNIAVIRLDIVFTLEHIMERREIIGLLFQLLAMFSGHNTSNKFGLPRVEFSCSM